MAIASATGVLALTTAAVGNTFAVTGLSFAPTAVIVWVTGRSDATDAIGRADARRCFGVFTGPTARACVVGMERDNQGAALSTRRRVALTDCCLGTISSAGAVDGKIDVQSMDSGGFTLVVDDALPVALAMGWLAIGGTTAVAVGTFTTPAAGTAPTTQDITSVGFQPDAVLMASVSTGSTGSAASNDAMCVGAAAGATPTNAVWAGRSQGPTNPSATLAYAKTGECLAAWTSSTAASLFYRASVSAWLSNGFTLSWTEFSSTVPILVIFLALQGGAYAVGGLTTQTDTVTNIVVSGLSVAPTGVLFLSACRAQSAADTPTANDQLSIGAATSASSRSAQGSLDEDAKNPSETTTAIEYDACYVNIATDSTVQGVMDLVSLDATGLTAIMDDADPSGNFAWYFAAGNAAAAGNPWYAYAQQS